MKRYKSCMVMVAVFILAMMLLPAPSSASLKDSTMIKQYLVNGRDLNKSQFKCPDTLDDGEVNLKDSTFIRQWLVDKSTPLWESPADDDMAKPETC